MGKASPRPTPRRTGAPVGPRPAPSRSVKRDPDALPVWVVMLVGLHMLLLLSIVLAMTPFTNNLDDIKQTIYYIGAPILMIVALIGLYKGIIPLPPKLAGGALAAYWLVMVVSTLYMSTGLRQADFKQLDITSIRWMGWDQVLLIWGAGGLFLSALCAGAYPKTNVWFVRYLVLQWLLVVVIGLLMYDPWTVGGHKAVVSILCDKFFGNDSNDNGALYQLLLTLRSADTDLQSTILNREFYSSLCLLYIPFALLLTLDPGPSRHPAWWRATGGATALLATASVFLCRSKGEYLFWTLMLGYFGVMFIFFGHTAGIRRRNLLAGGGACLLVLVTLGWMKSPAIINNMNSVSGSLDARKIMWSAAWKIFKQFPILGGGPGSYRVYFDTYRAPDYYLHAIANVTTFCHNYFLDLLAETGLCGFCAFVIFLSALWFSGFRWVAQHPDGRLRMVLLACTAALFGFFGPNLSNPNARWIIGASNLWAVLGFLAGSIALAHGWKPQLAAAASAAFSRRHMALGAVILLALPLAAWSAYDGYAYFNSAVKYATGVEYMEGGMNQLGEGDMQKQEAQQGQSMLLQSHQLFTDAIAADPKDVSAYYKLGSVDSTLDRIYATLAAQDQATGDQRNAEINQKTSDQLCAMALDRYSTLDHLMPDYAEIHYNFGIVYEQMVEILHRQAATASPEIAQQLLKQADQDEVESRKHLERMHEQSVKQEVYELLGNQYASRRMLDDAFRIYKEGALRYPDDKDLITHYHDAAMETQRPEDAFNALDMLWHLDPFNRFFVSRMFELCLQAKLAVQLGQLANELMRMDPLDPNIYSARIYLADWRDDPQQVMTEADRYIKTGGMQAAPLQIAAKAAVRLGNNQKAAEYQQYIQKISRKEVVHPPGSPQLE